MNRLPALATALALILVALAAPALAQPPADRGRGGPPDGVPAGGDDARGPPADRPSGADRDGQGPPEWAREGRDVSFMASGRGFSYLSERASDRAEDAIRAAFDAREARLNTTYDTERGQGPRGFGLSVHFRSLLEYRDLDADGKYSIGDEVVQYIPLRGHDSANVTTSTGADGVKTATAVYPLGNGTGNLTLLFTITPVVHSMPNATVTPVETKFDVILTDFPYQENDTAVALVTKAAAGRDLAADDGPAPQPGLTLREGDVEAFYRWVPTSDVDGVNASVGVTVLSEHLTGGEGNGTVVVFSYARGDHIVHDPTVGFTTASAAVDAIVDALTGDWRLFGAGLLAAAALVAVTAGPRLRRR